jgi:two-component system sensor histidine kinase BarA
MYKVIDTEEALSLAAGDEDLARDMFNMLINELPAHLDAIRASYAADDRTTLQHHVHKVNGATRYCGVPALREATDSLEQAIKQDMPDIPDKYEKMLFEVDRLLEEKDNHL